MINNNKENQQTKNDLLDQTDRLLTEAIGNVNDSLNDEILRAQKAESINADEISKINALIESILGNDDDTLNSIKEFTKWVEDHGVEVGEITKSISDEDGSCKRCRK